MINNKMHQLFIIFILFSLCLSLSIIVTEEFFFEHKAVEMALLNAVKKTEERESVLESFLEHAEYNLTAIRESVFFIKYLQNNKNKDELIDFLLALAKFSPEFMQFRYIDENGFEKIKIDKSSITAQPVLISENKLQNKSDRYYFSLSKSRELEKIWFSAMDLYTDNNNIAIPYKPTIRAILPVRINNKFGGILIINYFIENLLKKLTFTPLYDMIIFDNKGYTIFHYDDNHDNQKNWGNSLPEKYNIAEEYPNDFTEILSAPTLKTPKFVSRKFLLPIHNGLNLILQLKESYATRQDAISHKHYIGLSCIVFALSLFLTFLVIKIFRRTLLNLDKVEQLNKTITEASKVAQMGFWEYNAKTADITWSDGVYDILELSETFSNITFKKFLSFVAEEDRAKLKREFYNSLNNKSDYFITHKVITDNNKVKYVEERGKNYFDRHNKLIKTLGSMYDITERYLFEETIKIQHQEQQTLLSLFDISDSILIKWNNDEYRSVKYVSNNIEKLLGYTKEEILTSQILYTDCIYKDDLQKVINEVKENSDSQRSYFNHQPYRIVTNTGKIKWVYEQTVIQKDEDGNIKCYIGYIIDISKDKEYELALEESGEKLRDSKKKMEAIFNNALEGIVVLELNKKYLFFNNKYCEMTGYKQNELKNKYYYDLITPYYLDEFNLICKKVLEDGYYENFSYECITKNGTVKRFNSSIALLPHEKQFLITTVDQTELYQAMRIIKKQSNIDVLTQLNNRKSYNERVNELFALYQRYNISFSMIMFDIDFFKSINDTYGHQKGDEVLIRLSDIVRSVIRKSDYIFRIGGEEFIILLTKTNKANSIIVAEKLRKEVENRLDTIPDKKITISIGVTEINNTDTIESIYNRVDKNLYYAKNNGRNMVASHI